MNEICPTKKCDNKFLAQIRLFTRQLLNPLHLLLLIFGLASALIGQYEPTLTILASILFVCAISYAKEFQLHKRQPERATEDEHDTTTDNCAKTPTRDTVASVTDSPQNTETLTSAVPARLLLANIDQLSEYLVVIYCTLIALVTIVGIIQQLPPSESAYYALSLAILAIPEGLPALVAGLSSGAADDNSDQYVYLSIHNFLVYQMSISFTSIVLIAIAFAGRTDPALSVYHLLYVNILADGPPGQSLGCEQPSEEELSLWPRTVHDPLVSWRLIGTTLSLTSTLIALNAALYNYLLDPSGHLDEHARTLLFSCFVFCTAFAALSLRSKFKTIFESRIYANLRLLFSCTTLVLIQIGLTQIGALGELLQIEPVAPLELLYVFLYASLTLLVMDCLKVLARCLSRGRSLLIKLAHRLQVPSAPFADSFYSTSSLAKANKFTNDTNHDTSTSANSISNNSSGIGSSFSGASSLTTKFDCLAAGRLASGSSPQCTAIMPLPSQTHNGSAHF